MEKHRKIRYVPGMISLIFLPILCISYLHTHFKEERCIELAVPTKNSPDRYNIFDEKIVVPMFKNYRHYIDITLDSDEVKNKTKLKLFKNLLEKIKQTNDTVHGVHLIFKGNVKYGTVIQAYNITSLEEEYPTFLLLNDDLWVIWHKGDKERMIKYKEALKRQAIEDSLTLLGKSGPVIIY